jgi:hypothetical protein
VSYQREDERYWTDYLRVALPIVGLLLLFGLLWFWLTSIIGDDNNDQPTATPTQAVAVVVTAPASTATVPAAQGITPTVETNQPTQAAGEPTTPPEENPTETPAEAPKFAKGDTVVVNDDNVNIRADHSTDAESVEVVLTGTELTITGSSRKGGDYTWWPVSDDATGVTGWIAEDFIDAG